MPRPLLIIFTLILVIKILLPQPLYASSDLVFINGEEVSVSLSDNSAVLYLPTQALTGPSRVSLSSSESAADLPSDSLGLVYSWQVLDAKILQPLKLIIKYDNGDDLGVFVWHRKDSSQGWELAEYKSVGNKIEIMVSEESGQVVLSKINPLPFTITLDQATVGKGYHIETPDGFFGWHILPEAFVSPVTAEINPLSVSTYPPPSDLKLVSPIYHFKIDVDNEYIIPKDLPVEIKFFPGQDNDKEIYYWDNFTNTWEVSPSLTRYQDGLVRTLTHQKEMILAVMSGSIMERGKASWYKYKNGNFAASPDYAKGTKLKVTNIANGQSVIVTVNDYGPDRSVHPDRVIDLDYVAFKKIASPSLGVIEVSVEEIFY